MPRLATLVAVLTCARFLDLAGKGMSCCIKGPLAADGCPLHDAKGMVSGAKIAGPAPPACQPPPPPGPPYHHTGPLTCQDNDMFPMLPTFHIIGNVSQATDGAIKLEPINDASGVTFYNGIYHVWHQCCQNHWDHVGDSAHLSCPFRVAHRSSE